MENRNVRAQPSNRDPLAVPLDGVQLIEASAGTGKTYTLATLFTRLVVERNLRIGQVLAVTFTDAATQELRKRIRARLALAAAQVKHCQEPHAAPEIALTRTILADHLARSGEAAAALEKRLRLAAEETDLAAVFTIHGFCARVLSEYALDSGHRLDGPELVTNLKPLHAEVAADLWRVLAQDADQVAVLTTLWKNHAQLAADLPALLGEEPLFPQPLQTGPEEISLAQAQQRLHEAGPPLQQAIASHGEDFRQALLAAVENKWLNGNSYKAGWIHELFEQFRHWDGEGPLHEKAANLLPETLLGRTSRAGAGKTPASPLQAPLAHWMQARQSLDNVLRAQSIHLLHSLRQQARQRMQHLKSQRRLQTYDDLIEGVARALEGPRGDALVAQLRQQYAIALVDEFQDTDPRQWAIFRRVFGHSEHVQAAGKAAALFLIGDPKQAIYGFRGGDVHTYLQAKTQANVALMLDHNFRSRPCVLAAIDALYTQAGERGFSQEGIRFETVHAGRADADADFTIDAVPAPGLVLQRVQWDGDKPLSADQSRQLATELCADAIATVLWQGRQGQALIKQRPVQAGDIAVLVRSHREATLIQQALQQRGVAAVAAGKQSLFASEQAGELRLLLLALLQPADEGRLRALLATVLLGASAGDIAALEVNGDLQREHQNRLQLWRERLQRGGPYALIADLCAERAQRLLAIDDGERRMTNYLQLGELLQEAARKVLGLAGLLDWLEQAIALADSNDEAQLLRLESDARRVQILTLHKSKGLEYPLVFLPFVGIGSSSGSRDRHTVVQVDKQRQRHWKLDKEDPAWKQVMALRKAEDHAETARLLYVGLTRAVHQLWLAHGNLAGASSTTLHAMLDGLGGHEAIQLLPWQAEREPVPPLPVQAQQAVAPVRTITRPLAVDWWVYSFTQLAHAERGNDPSSAATEAPAAAEDEPADSPVPELGSEPPVERVAFDRRFSGSRFGNALHLALENSDFAAWQGWRGGQPAPAGSEEPLLKALRGEGYPDQGLADGLAVLAELVGQTLTQPLPEGVRLCELPASQRRAEIEFHFALQPTHSQQLLALLHAHGVAAARHGFGLRRQLEGLMTGKIDLTYTHNGQWFVLDYKSNRLPRYDAAALEAAMAESEYDLQALLYTVALHRWLRFRLGSGYDYERDFGGIRYLFARGLDAADPQCPGLHARCFPAELVHGLDVLFAGGQQAHARLLGGVA